MRTSVSAVFPMEWIKQTVLCLGEGQEQYQEEAGIIVFQKILHSHLPILIPRSTVLNPATVAVMEVLTQHLYSPRIWVLGQPPVIDLNCTSPDSVVHDDFNSLSSTLHNHSVAASSHNHSPPPLPRKTLQSHSILVNETKSTCTSNHSTAPSAPSVSNVLDSMDTQLHFTS